MKIKQLIYSLYYNAGKVLIYQRFADFTNISIIMFSYCNSHYLSYLCFISRINLRTTPTPIVLNASPDVTTP